MKEKQERKNEEKFTWLRMHLLERDSTNKTIHSNILGMCSTST